MPTAIGIGIGVQWGGAPRAAILMAGVGALLCATVYDADVSATMAGVGSLEVSTVYDASVSATMAGAGSLTVDYDYEGGEVTPLSTYGADLAGEWDTSATGALLVSAGGAVAANGAGVGSIVDQSGNDHHASQGTGSAKPTRADGAENGLDVVTCDAGDGLETDSIDLTGTQEAELWAVAKADDAATLYGVISFGWDPIDFELLFSNGTAGAASAFAYDNGDSTEARTAAGTGVTALHVWRITVDISLGTNEVEIYRDGTLVTNSRPFNDDCGSANLGSATVKIGTRNSGGTITNGLAGTFCHGFLVKRLSTAPEASALTDALKAKWGIA